MSDSLQPTYDELLARVNELSQSFKEFLTEKKIPLPTFEADSVTRYDGLTAEMFVKRQHLLDSLADLHYLVQGPSESIFNYAHNCMPDVAALDILNQFKFWSAVPLAGTATYADIAKQVNLPEEAVRRVLDHAKTLRIFADAEAGNPDAGVRHSSRSAALAQSPGLQSLVSTIVSDAGPPMTVVPQALAKFSRGKTSLPSGLDQTAFNLFHNGKYANSWDYIENDGEGEEKGWRSRNFTTFMTYLKDIFQLEAIVEGCYDWDAAGDISVVDLGGSAGHDAFVLAKKHPNLTITVQDLPKVQSVFEASVPEELKSRVSFISHDFFKPQPVQADLYLIKMILHDWPDAECISILQALRPSLKPGARIVLIEYVGKHDPVVEEGPQDGAWDSKEGSDVTKTKEPPLPRSIQQMGTSTDLRMLALFSTKERVPSAWKAVISAADERFEIAKFETNPFSFFVIIEVVWRG
ncbi:uncharacterized protein DNG_01709 [Cephalotrichum gorgonifer]|uniref:O-methyltransferase C-terminal domain-containing protein n=1 Tax=Cephalotrichum gorgonifer TaxID=2041049 RepID=A0AAE8MT54_9PEZI|nr:uncharacterized protein DNG_01709 [Cephalotrichum gorgonifer]